MPPRGISPVNAAPVIDVGLDDHAAHRFQYGVETVCLRPITKARKIEGNHEALHLFQLRQCVSALMIQALPSTICALTACKRWPRGVAGAAASLIALVALLIVNADQRAPESHIYFFLDRP